ncbi:Cofilin [Dactylellina cionopaga]|nr:Cofilin [Dactylellina cionopaga]
MSRPSISPEVSVASRELNNNRDEQRYVIMGITKEDPTVTVLKASLSTEWSEVTAEFPDSEPRFALHNFHFQHEGKAVSKLIFIFWSPEDAETRLKMMYTSAKSVLEPKLGYQYQIPCTDREDLEYESFLAAVKARMGA